MIYFRRASVTWFVNAKETPRTIHVARCEPWRAPLASGQSLAARSASRAARFRALASAGDAPRERDGALGARRAGDAGDAFATRADRCDDDVAGGAYARVEEA